MHVQHTYCDGRHAICMLRAQTQTNRAIYIYSYSYNTYISIHISRRCYNIKAICVYIVRTSPAQYVYCLSLCTQYTYCEGEVRNVYTARGIHLFFHPRGIHIAVLPIGLSTQSAYLDKRRGGLRMFTDSARIKDMLSRCNLITVFHQILRSTRWTVGATEGAENAPRWALNSDF